MARMTLIVTALIAAACAMQASFARTGALSRHAQAQTTSGRDCVRAPNVGAFATAPYTVPPCLPGSAN